MPDDPLFSEYASQSMWYSKLLSAPAWQFAGKDSDQAPEHHVAKDNLNRNTERGGGRFRYYIAKAKSGKCDNTVIKHG